MKFKARLISSVALGIFLLQSISMSVPAHAQTKSTRSNDDDDGTGQLIVAVIELTAAFLHDHPDYLPFWWDCYKKNPAHALVPWDGPGFKWAMKSCHVPDSKTAIKASLRSDAPKSDSKPAEKTVPAALTHPAIR